MGKSFRFQEFLFVSLIISSKNLLASPFNCRDAAQGLLRIQNLPKPGRLVVYRGEIEINLKEGGSQAELKNEILKVFDSWFKKKGVSGNFEFKEGTLSFVFQEQDRSFTKPREALWEVECLLYPSKNGGFRLSTTVTHVGKIGGPQNRPSGIPRPGFIREFFNPEGIFETRLANQNITGSGSITIRNLNDFEMLWEQMNNSEARTPIILVSLNYQNMKTRIEVTKQFLDSLEGVATVFIESADFPLYKEFHKRGYPLTRRDLNGGVHVLAPKKRLQTGPHDPNWSMESATIDKLASAIGFTNLRRIIVNLAMDSVVDFRF